jgi:hypothetical protein
MFILSGIHFVDKEISTLSMPALMKLGNLLPREQGLQLSVEGNKAQISFETINNRWSISKGRVRTNEEPAFNLRLLVD